MSEKRGQITIFVLLGIVILLFASVSYYLIGKRNEVEQRQIPTDIADVVSFVEDCMYELGTDAAFILGQQAGYIELPRRINENPWAYLEPLPGIKQPFWYYQGQNLYPPNVAAMEQDVNNYISSKLPLCLRNFSLLAARYDIEPAGGIETSSQMTNNDVVINVKYPLKIYHKGSATTADFSEFIVHVPARVKKAYELAVRLLLQENREVFLERETLNLMVINDEIPFTDIKFDCDRLRWSLDGTNSISESVKETLFWNMPRIRVRNTAHEPFAEPINNYEKLDRYDSMALADFENIALPDSLPADAYEYKHLYWDIGLDKKEYADFNVNFNYYRSWPLAINARPSVGRELVSNHGKGHKKFLNFFCVNSYHYTYDLSFPVEVNVYDEKSFNGEGYNFRYIIPVLISRNQPDRASALNVGMPVPERDTEFCHEDNRDYSKEYSLKVINPITQDKGINANISFECGPYLCVLGRTSLANLYNLKAYLPKNCRPGRIAAEAAGFYPGEASVAENNAVTVELSPFNSLFMEFYARHPSDLDKDIAFTEQDANKEITVTFYSEELDYSADLFVNDTHTFPNGLELPDVSTSYDVSIWLSKLNAKGEKIIVAGYRNDNWTVKASDISSAKKIILTLYGPDTVPITDAEQLAFYTALDTDAVKEKLKPELR